MKFVKMKLNFKELMILDHALNSYLNREYSTQIEINEENKLLDRINNNIKCIKRPGYGRR